MKKINSVRKNVRIEGLSNQDIRPSQLYAHRGKIFAHENEENTLSQLCTALQLGLEIETDVRKYKDTLVLCHDAKYKDTPELATLNDLLTAALSYLNPKLNLEIKESEAVEDALNLVSQYKTITITFSSFDWTILTFIASKQVHFPLYLLVDKESEYTKPMVEVIENAIQIARKINAEGITIDHSLLTLERIQKIKNARLKLNLFTCNNKQEAQQFLAMGVDRLFTDCASEFCGITNVSKL